MDEFRQWLTLRMDFCYTQAQFYGEQGNSTSQDEWRARGTVYAEVLIELGRRKLEEEVNERQLSA